SKTFSASCAKIPAPIPQYGQSSSTISSRLVFVTDSMIVFSSSGRSVRTSMISALIPSLPSSISALRQSFTHLLQQTMVMSSPSFLMSATPMGSVYSPSGTSPLSASMTSDSRNMTGSSQRMALLSRPLASYGVDGAMTTR